MPRLGIGVGIDKSRRVGALPIPTDGLQLWLKPETLAELYVNNDPIGLWPDSSGNGRNATGAGISRPLYLTASPLNGNVGCSYAIGMYLDGAVPIAGNDLSCFLVWGYNAVSQAWSRGFSLAPPAGGDSGPGGFIELREAGNNNIATYREGAFGVLAVVPGTNWLQSTRWKLAAGSNNALNAGAPSVIGAFPGSPLSSTRYCMGTDPDHVGSFLEGRIFEVVLYNRYVTDDEYNEINAYLMAKYAL